MSYTYYRIKVKPDFRYGVGGNGDPYRYYRIKNDKRFKLLRRYNPKHDYFHKSYYRGISQLVKTAPWYESHIKITEDEFNKYLLIDKIGK